MAASFVYVISGDHGRQKIGVSDNPAERIRDLQTGSPFKLRFEFVGLTAGTAFDIEGEAHFMLANHKAPGGDEWFIVPTDVAITAVMAAAHRLGHEIRPVDPDQIGRYLSPTPAARQRWETVLLAVISTVIILPAFYRAAWGEVGFFYVVFMAGIAAALYCGLRTAAAGLRCLSMAILKAPSSQDRT